MKKFICCLGLLVGMISIAHANPSLIKNTITTQDGCKVSNPNPQANETITWTGGCANGFADGYGELVWYIDGVPTDYYAGTYQQGMMHGVGQYRWQDGSRYTGVFVHDQSTGFGEYIANKGHLVMLGSFNDGLNHGEVTVYLSKALMDDEGMQWADFLLSAGAGHWQGEYFVYDGIFEDNELVAVCGIDEHESC